MFLWYFSKPLYFFGCKIVPADDSGRLYLRLGYGTRWGSTSGGDITIERTVLLYIAVLHGLLRCLIEPRSMFL